MKPIDTGALKDNLTDIFGDEDRLVCLKDVLDLIDEQPALTQPNELTPCDLCFYYPPSRSIMKPCSFCPAEIRLPEGDEK